MEFLNFNSVELLPNVKASAAFMVDSGKVFSEDTDIAPVVISESLSYIPWGADNQMPFETLSTCQMFNAEVCYGKCSLYITQTSPQQRQGSRSKFLSRKQHCRLLSWSLSGPL